MRLGKRDTAGLELATAHFGDSVKMLGALTSIGYILGGESARYRVM